MRGDRLTYAPFAPPEALPRGRRASAVSLLCRKIKQRGGQSRLPEGLFQEKHKSRCEAAVNLVTSAGPQFGLQNVDICGSDHLPVWSDGSHLDHISTASLDVFVPVLNAVLSDRILKPGENRPFSPLQLPPVPWD